MPTMDIFEGDAFSIIEFTRALENIPYKPATLSGLGLFGDRGVRSRTVVVESRDGTLSLIPFSERGSAYEQQIPERRDVRAFVCRQFKKQDVLWASEIQAIRDFGSESAIQQVQTEVARRLRRLRSDAEATFEYHLLNGIQGIVKDPKDGATVIDYGRDPLPPVKDAVTADGDVVVPIDVEAFGVWLKACFGQPTTTGSGPYTHEFRTGGWTLPSLAIETAMPEVPRFTMYAGCVLDQISWTLQRSGLLTATARLVAQGETVGTVTGGSAPADFALKRFGHFNGAITRNGSTLGNVVSAEIAYANNLDRIETIRADGRIDGADPTIAALTGRIEARFADQVLLTQAIDGDPCELAFAYTLPSGESLTLTAHAVYLPRPRIEIQGPQGVQSSVDWEAARDAVLGRMGTITLVNDIESY